MNFWTPSFQARILGGSESKCLFSDLSLSGTAGTRTLNFLAVGLVPASVEITLLPGLPAAERANVQPLARCRSGVRHQGVVEVEPVHVECSARHSTFSHKKTQARRGLGPSRHKARRDDLTPMYTVGALLSTLKLHIPPPPSPAPPHSEKSS